MHKTKKYRLDLNVGHLRGWQKAKSICYGLNREALNYFIQSMTQATELTRATIHEFYFEDAYEDTSLINLSLFSLSNQDPNNCVVPNSSFVTPYSSPQLENSHFF